MASRMTSPTRSARRRKPDWRIISTAASAAAHATGFPPYVPPMPPRCAESMISARPVTALIGMPAPSDFAVVSRSGTTPECSIAKSRPVRPNPLCTSSAIITMPCWSHSSRMRRRKRGGTGMNPASP